MIQKTIESKLNNLRSNCDVRRNSKHSYCLYVNNTLPHAESTMQDLYDRYKAEDGFLYIRYTEM